MTVREALKEMGGFPDDENEFYIEFVGEHGSKDEFEVDASTIEDLETQWETFASESNCKTDSITYIGTRRLEDVWNHALEAL